MERRSMARLNQPERRRIDSCYTTILKDRARREIFKVKSRTSSGEPVIRLDVTEWRERLHQVEASIQSARTELDRRKASMEATAGFPLPKELWHTQEELGLVRERIRTEARQTQRVRELFDKGLDSRQDSERAAARIIIRRVPLWRLPLPHPSES
jgi:hypothetical protein